MSLLHKLRPLLALLVSDVLVFLAHASLSKKLGFFNLEKEGNLGSLQAGLKFWGAGTAAYLSAWIIAQTNIHRARWLMWLFIALGTGFAYIGLDDMMALHERAGFVINHLLGKGGFYGESFNWLLYFSPFMILALGTFGILLIWLRKQNTLIFSLFLIGVALCLLSLGAEWLGGKMILSTHLVVERYRLLILIEEGLEMVGASFLTAALLQLLSQLTISHVRLEKHRASGSSEHAQNA